MAKINQPSLTYWNVSWIRFKKNKLAVYFLAILLTYVFIGMFG
ncbi:hypothetical protein [Streptobacillus moniliformis]